MSVYIHAYSQIQLRICTYVVLDWNCDLRMCVLSSGNDVYWLWEWLRMYSLQPSISSCLATPYCETRCHSGRERGREGGGERVRERGRESEREGEKERLTHVSTLISGGNTPDLSLFQPSLLAVNSIICCSVLAPSILYRWS